MLTTVRLQRGCVLSEEGTVAALILLDAQKGRWDFPELKHMAMEAYKFWEPETVIIEAKASGMPLTQDLRNMESCEAPSRGNDKVRVHVFLLCLRVV